MLPVHRKVAFLPEQPSQPRQAGRVCAHQRCGSPPKCLWEEGQPASGLDGVAYRQPHSPDCCSFLSSPCEMTSSRKRGEERDLLCISAISTECWPLSPILVVETGTVGYGDDLVPTLAG